MLDASKTSLLLINLAHQLGFTDFKRELLQIHLKSYNLIHFRMR